MSPIGVAEPFHRLEEFPSFLSCITCFGKPIIPPLLTSSLRLELQQVRAVAVNKEADILKRKKDLKLQEKLLLQVSSKDFTYSDIPTNIQKSCALWYPSCNDCHEGVSVAISKLPTSGIYSSVHTGAIVCSNVIENNHRYASKIQRDSSFDSENSNLGCAECSHSNINLNCNLCRAEFDQSFHNCSFGSEISPEVPCRTFSLLEQNTSQVDDDQNSTVEETECESLPTVISTQKHAAFDTDTESNVTSMTQSTDLEKYMEVSCEFNSPDNSTSIWDSRSTSQQYTLSRSDDASSETVVNTENELTPCASTIAEFTDNEFSIADDTANLTVSKNPSIGMLKRSHSVDSYMKIFQTYGRNMHVKKSSSEPLNTNSKLSSSIDDDIKVFSSSKISHLIKEDSKESEESKDLLEKDINIEEINKDVSSPEEIIAATTDKNISHQKRHVRQNSYTLDEPSFALIQAHGDCSCSFDASCISPPHCSALKDEDTMSNSAFMKETLAIDIPVSVKERYPILSSNALNEDTIKEDLMPPVVDVFPEVKEVCYEKSNAENSTTSEDVLKSESTSATESNSCLKRDEAKLSNEKSLHNYSSIASQEYFKHIFIELQEKHELRMRELREEQNRQWLKLQEELKEQEMRFYEKVKQSITSPPGIEPKAESPNKYETSPGENNVASCTILSEDDAFNCGDSDTYSEQSVLFNNCDTSMTCIHISDVSPQNTSPISNSSACHNNSAGTRALITPSSDCKTPNTPSTPPKNASSIHNIPNPNASIVYTSEYNKNLYSCASNPLHNINGFPPESAVLLPQCDSRKFNNSVVSSGVNFVSASGFCKTRPKECDCCISYNGYSEINSDLKYISSNNSELYNPPRTSSSVNVPIKNFKPMRLNSGDNLSFINTIEDNPVSLRKGGDILDNSCYSRQKIEGANSCFSKEVATPDALPKNAKGSLITKNSKSVSSPDILQSPRDNRNSPQQTSKDKTKLPLNNIISLCVKSLQSGSVSLLGAGTNEQIVIDPALLKRFDKLPAFVKGYLTRRLLKTERVQNYIKTLQDTILLIQQLSADISLKGAAISESDVEFHHQLIVQLMKTFHSVFDIFCTISTKERMNIIAESRNFRLKQKLSEQNQEWTVPVTSNVPVPDPSKKHKLSAATEKAIIRRDKKRPSVDSSSSIDSTTYTVEDFRRARSVGENRSKSIEGLKDHSGRPRSHTLSKSHSTPPSSIHKVNIGEFPKRKTTISKTSHLRRNENRWVP